MNITWRTLLASACFVFAGCGTDKGAVTQVGMLSSGTIALINHSGKIEAFPPAASEPRDLYTILTTASAPAIRTVTRFDRATNTLTVCPLACPPPASAGSVAYLIRIPKNVHAYLMTTSGDIHVSDVSGPVDAVDTNGDIKIQIPSYANARTVKGNVSVTFGDVNWPGTLHFSSDRGDVEVYVPAIANAHVDLHTDHGTVYTDFDLHGSSQGDAETIVGNLGGGANRGVVVRVKNGSIRLLKLVPQM